MALIDSRGRLWGRVNIIDLAVGLVLVGIIPLAYGAFLLFRQPEPTIRSVSPTKLPAKPSRLRIEGDKLRPFLRVFLNDQQGTTFALIDERTAEVDLPALRPGTYDVILFDVAREVSRLPGAVTVEPPPVVDHGGRVMVWGSFLALEESTARDLRPGLELSAAGGGSLTVVERGPAVPDTRVLDFVDRLETPLAGGVRVPAALRGVCRLFELRCQIGGESLGPRTMLILTGSSSTAMRFEVGRITADGPTQLTDLRATFAVPAEGMTVIRAGQRAVADNMLGDRVPLLVSVGSARRVPATTAVPYLHGTPSPNESSFSLTDTVTLVDATVRLRLDVTGTGLQNRGLPIRIGSTFAFEAPTYVLRGWIRGLDLVEEDNDGR
jgi:uncharacterized protein DUF4330